MQKKIRIFWTLAITIAILSHFFSVLNREISYFFAAPLITAVRIFYSGAIAWMILASATGHGGIFAKILNHPAFVHVNKLSYAIYLLNPLVITVIYGSKDHSTHVEPLTMVSSSHNPIPVPVLITFFSISPFADNHVGGHQCGLLFVVICIFHYVWGAVHKSVRTFVET